LTRGTDTGFRGSFLFPFQSFEIEKKRQKTNQTPGDRLTAEAVTEAARQIHMIAIATAPLSLYWQDAPYDVQPLTARRGNHRRQ
jgi:hypothetical protein